MYQQQQQQQQMQMMLNIRNLQLTKLQEAYPGMAFIRESQSGQEWRLPLQLPNSQQPLWIKVTVGPQFPYTKPIV